MSDYLGEPRFIVRETHGLAKPSIGANLPGMEVVVLDRAYCCARCASWITENQEGRTGYGWTRERVFAEVRRLAAERCAELNAAP